MYIIIFIITGIIIISHQLIKHNDKYLPQTVHSNHFLHSNCCMSRHKNVMAGYSSDFTIST